MFGILGAHLALAQGPAGVPGGRNLDPKEISESVSKYEQLVRERPDSAEAWSNLGVVRAMAGNCKDALPALERAELLDARLYNPWFFSAYCHFAFHESARADQNLQRALRLNPRDSNAWFLKAQVNNDLGRYADSLDALVKAQAFRLGAGGRQSGAGSALRADPESLYLAGRDALELATRLYARVMKPSPTPDFHSLLLDGERNAALSGWELAINKYQRALKISPHRPDAEFALGSAYLESGNYAEAEKSFRRCLELAPDAAWARVRLALTLIEESKQAEAQKLFLAMNSDELELPAEYQDVLWFGYVSKLGDIAQRALARAKAKFPYQEDWSEWLSRLASPPVGPAPDTALPLKPTGLTGVGLALRFFLTAKQAKGNDFATVFSTPAAYQAFRADFLSGDWVQAAGRIVPLLKAGKADTAAHAFAIGEILHSLSYGFHEQLGLQFPDSTPAMKLAAEHLSTMGDQQKALEIYQAVVQRDGPTPEILGEMARIYWSDHNWEQALQVLEPLSRMDPNDATIFVNMGRIYAYEQKSENAARAFERAIQLEPKMSEAHFGLAQILRAQGDFKGALRESKIASELDPKDPKAHYLLSQVYSKLGEKDLAARELASFQKLGTLAKMEAGERNRLLVPVE